MPQENNVGTHAAEAFFSKHLPWLDSATLSIPDDGYTTSFVVQKEGQHMWAKLALQQERPYTLPVILKLLEFLT